MFNVKHFYQDAVFCFILVICICFTSLEINVPFKCTAALASVTTTNQCQYKCSPVNMLIAATSWDCFGSLKGVLHTQGSFSCVCVCVIRDC